MSGTLRIHNVDAQASGTGLTFKTTGGTGIYNHNGVPTVNDATVRLFERTNTNYIGLKAPTTIATAFDFVLPNVDGTANQVLITSGAPNHTLSFASAGTLPGVVTTSTGTNWVNDNRITKTVGGTTQIEETQWIIDDTADGDLHTAGNGNIVLDDDNQTGAGGGTGSALYFGSKTPGGAGGAWRIRVNGTTAATNSLVFEQSDGTTFVEKGSFAA